MMEDFSLLDFFDTVDTSRRKVRDVSFECSCEGCKEKAIDNSHLLQQNPFIYSIADENKKVFQICDNEIHPRTGGYNLYKPRLITVKKAMCLPLFCDKHDSELFKPIETPGFDIRDKKNQLLFSYRALCAQRCIEQKRLAFYEENDNDGGFNDFFGAYSKSVINRFDFSIRKIWHDIQLNSISDYVFKIVKMPKVPICLSDCIVDEDELWNAYVSNKRTKYCKVLYAHLLPFERESNLIIGYHKNRVSNKQLEYYNSWKLYYEVIDKQAVFGLLARFINWCCSTKLVQGRRESFVNALEFERIKIFINENSMSFASLDCLNNDMINK